MNTAPIVAGLDSACLREGFSVIQGPGGLSIAFADDRYTQRERQEIADAASRAAGAKLDEIGLRRPCRFGWCEAEPMDCNGADHHYTVAKSIEGTATPPTGRVGTVPRTVAATISYEAGNDESPHVRVYTYGEHIDDDQTHLRPDEARTLATQLLAAADAIDNGPQR